MFRFFCHLVLCFTLLTATSAPCHGQGYGFNTPDKAMMPQAPDDVMTPQAATAPPITSAPLAPETMAPVPMTAPTEIPAPVMSPVDPAFVDGLTRTLMAYPEQSQPVLANSMGIDTTKIDLEKFNAMLARQDYQEIHQEVTTLAVNRDAFNAGQFTNVSYYRVPTVPVIQPAYSPPASLAAYGTVAGLAIAGGLGAVALSGGGGGSSGSGSGVSSGTNTDAYGRRALPDLYAPSSFVDTEFAAFPEGGLAKEKAQYAWAKGLTGTGVKIGFYDFFTTDGSSNSEVSARITYRNLNIPLDTAALALDCALYPGDIEACNHGVAVMQYAAGQRNGNGYLGVAYQASLQMYSVYATGTARDLADQNPNIINFSCGNCATLADLQYIKTKNILMTSATGNGGTANPDPTTPATNASQLDYSLIAVTGVYDIAGVPTATAYDKCGTQMEYCMAAYSGTGTSFAAPQIAGAAAVLKQGWSFLTPKQISKILLTSAKDLGTTGVDAIYGHGLLDLQAAVQPIGALSMLSGTGATTNFAPSLIQQNQSSPFGNAFANPANAKGAIVVTDSFGRDFKVKVQDNLVVVPTHTLSPATLSLLGKKTPLQTAKFSGQLSMQYKEQQNSDGSSDLASIAEYKMNGGTSLKLGFATDLASLVEDDRQDFEKSNFISADIFKNGFLNVSDNNQVLYQAVQFNGDGPVKTKLSTFYSRQNHEVDYFQPKAEQQLTSAYASTMLENSFAPNDKTRLNLKTGLTNESDAVLGTKFSGGFDLADGANTYFTGFDASYDVTPDVNLSGSYTFGMTQVKPAAASAFNNVSNLMSDSFFVTATKRNLLDHDSLSLSVGQPTRIRSGIASGLTQQVDPDTGAVSTAHFQQSLVPTGQSFLFQAAYGKELSDDISVNLAFQYTTQPYQQKDADSDAAGLVKLVYKFK